MCELALLAKCWVVVVGAERSTQLFCAFVMKMSHAVFISVETIALREWK